MDTRPYASTIFNPCTTEALAQYQVRDGEAALQRMSREHKKLQAMSAGRSMNGSRLAGW
jgi:hypothetical protein